jgi:hypothetical protein
MTEVVDSLLEVELVKEDSFNIVRETLTRMGIPSHKSKTLFQSCHILSKNKRTKYYIVHFKELYALDGKETTLSPEDVARRNKIALLLEQWGWIKIIDRTKVENSDAKVKVIPHGEKNIWTLSPKYQLGLKKEEK